MRHFLFVAVMFQYCLFSGPTRPRRRGTPNEYAAGAGPRESSSLSLRLVGDPMCTRVCWLVVAELEAPRLYATLEAKLERILRIL